MRYDTTLESKYFTAKPNGSGEEFANNYETAFDALPGNYDIKDGYGYKKNPDYMFNNQETF